MTDGPSKILPNSYQTPNYSVDVLMRFLSGNEQKCVDVVCRKTFGWQKRTDRISKSQLMELTGLSEYTIYHCMAELVKFRVVVRLAESVKNLGVLWSLQLDDKKIDLKGLEERASKRSESNQKRTKNALTKRVGMLNIPTTLDIPPGGTLDIPHKSHYQKPLSSSSSSTEPEKIVLFFKHEIGKVTPTILEKLLKAKDTYSEEWVLDALEQSVTYNKKSWAYAETILKRWKQEGKIKTKGVNHANSNNGWSNSKRPAKQEPAQTNYSDSDREAAKRALAKRAKPNL
ncbi:MAG: replication protein [Chloroflexota bacterium]